MKIAFFCEEPDGVLMSSCITAIAYTAAVSFGYRSLVLHTGFGCHELENAYIEHPKALLLKEEMAYFYDSGIDLMLNRLSVGKLETLGTDRQTIPLKEGKLYYLPGTARTNREVYEEAFIKSGKKMLELLQRSFGVLFIACGREEDMRISEPVVDNADIIVAVGTQGRRNNEKLWNTVSQFGRERFFVVGMYDSESGYKLNDLKKELGIRNADIGRVPYNIRYQDAVAGGGSINFLESAFKKGRRGKEYAFAGELKRLTGKLLMKAGLCERQT